MWLKAQGLGWAAVSNYSCFMCGVGVLLAPQVMYTCGTPLCASRGSPGEGWGGGQAV